MAEYPAELITAVGVEAFFVILAKEIQEVLYIFFVNKGAVVFCPKELAEVEGFLVLHILAHQRTEVVGIDVDGWQRGVGVGIAHVR